MAVKWRVYGPDTVAAVLDKAELPGFYREAVVRPNEAALIVRNGRIEQVVTETAVRTSGFRDRLLRIIGRPTDAAVIFVDSSPFELEFYLGETVRAGANGTAVSIVALSADRQPVAAQVKMTVAVDIGDAGLISGLLRGRRALAIWDVAQLVQDELLAKVLIPQIAKHRAEELRGNTGLLDQIARSAEQELGTASRLWGLSLERFFLNWSLTEQEQQELAGVRARRAIESDEFDHQRILREKERDIELERARLHNLRELRVMDAWGDNELRDLYLEAQLDRDRLLDGQRLDRAKLEAEIRRVELAVKREETGLQLEVERQRDEQESYLDLREMEQLVELQEWRKSQNHLRELELRRLGNDRDRQEYAHAGQAPAAPREPHSPPPRRTAPEVPSRAYSSAGAGQTFAQLVGRVRASVVRIEGSSGSGSGFIVSPQGHVLTNAHVIDKAAWLNVVFPDGRRSTPTIVASDSAQDIALLIVETGRTLPALPLGRSVRQGEEVLALGFPMGLEGDMTATKGIISALRTSRGASYVQTDAALNPGNSGGPLVNTRGEVVGMNTSVFRGPEGIPAAEGIGFAIGAETLSNYLRKADPGIWPETNPACPQCGTSAQPNWNHCPHCRTRLSG